MNIFKSKIFYLIGDGYLGSSLKDYLIKKGATIIIQKKEDDLLTIKDFKKEGFKNKNIIILYFAAPNKYKDIKKINKTENKYIKIQKYLTQFKNVVFANTSQLFLQHNNLRFMDSNYIQCNAEIYTNTYFFNLLIPYVYSNELLEKKPKSFYSNIKNKNISKKEIENFQDNEIDAISLNQFLIQTIVKIEYLLKNKFNRNYLKEPTLGMYSSYLFTIKEFYDKVKKDIM